MNNITEQLSLPLEDKLLLTKIRIQQWYEYYDGKVYVAFSGGKDSTVLLNIVRSMYPDVPAVFNNTGLEYPEIKKFIKTIDNVIWLKPKKTYQAVVKEYGYAVIAKDVVQKVHEMRFSTDHIKNIRRNGYPETGYGKLAKKWHHLADNPPPFKMSNKCCDILKKNPAKQYEKETGNHPFIGTMAVESSTRLYSYFQTGCNSYDSKRPTSKPLSIWTEDNIWEYIKLYKIPYSKIYDMGFERTGCAWCAFGVHLEPKHNNRFHKMKKTHPKIWNYSINKMGLGKVFDYLKISYGTEKTLF